MSVNTQSAVSFYIAAKAWVGSVVAAITAVVVAVEAATADKAISLTEGQGIVMLVTAALGTLATFGSVWATRNAGQNTPGA